MVKKIEIILEFVEGLTRVITERDTDLQQLTAWMRAK